MSPLPPHGFPWDALARYFAGEMESAEAEALSRWIEEDPARREMVERVREVWVEAAALRQSWDAEAALQRIKQAPREPARVIRLAARAGSEAVPAARRAFAPALQIAAAGAGIVGGPGVWAAARARRGGGGGPAASAT